MPVSMTVVTCYCRSVMPQAAAKEAVNIAQTKVKQLTALQSAAADERRMEVSSAEGPSQGSETTGSRNCRGQSLHQSIWGPWKMKSWWTAWTWMMMMSSSSSSGVAESSSLQPGKRRQAITDSEDSDDLAAAPQGPFAAKITRALKNTDSEDGTDQKLRQPKKKQKTGAAAAAAAAATAVQRGRPRRAAAAVADSKSRSMLRQGNISSEDGSSSDGEQEEQERLQQRQQQRGGEKATENAGGARTQP